MKFFFLFLFTANEKVFPYLISHFDNNRKYCCFYLKIQFEEERLIQKKKRKQFEISKKKKLLKDHNQFRFSNVKDSWV